MTIAEVSRQYNVPVDTLRYYERIGLLPPVNRSKSGFRDYTEGDCQWVSFIKCMRSAGIPVEALIDYVTLFQQGDATREARRQILVEQRELLQARVAPQSYFGTLSMRGLPPGAPRPHIRVEPGVRHQARVEEQQRTLDYLSRKIQSYDQWNPGTEERLLRRAE